jgi:hypothetical protein
MQLAYAIRANLQLKQLQRLLTLSGLCQGTLNLGDEVVEKGVFSGTGEGGRCQLLGRSWWGDVRTWRRCGEEASEKEKYEPDPCGSCEGVPWINRCIL